MGRTAPAPYVGPGLPPAPPNSGGSAGPGVSVECSCDGAAHCRTCGGTGFRPASAEARP